MDISDVLRRSALVAVAVLIVALLALGIAGVTSESRKSDEDDMTRILSCHTSVTEPTPRHVTCPLETTTPTTTTTTAPAPSTMPAE